MIDDADLDAVFSIEQEANAYPWSRQQIKDCFEFKQELDTRAGKGAVLACLSEGNRETIAGFAIYSWALDEMSLLDLCVCVKLQGQGYGKSLLKYLLELAVASNKVKCFLEVRAANSKAIGLYESSGFRKNGVRKDYYPGVNGREDAILYSWSKS